LSAGHPPETHVEYESEHPGACGVKTGGAGQKNEGRTMNRYIAFTFGAAGQAAEARHVLRDMENRKELSLNDAVVLAQDDSGRTERRRDRSGVPVIGAIVGAMMGLLLAFAFPVVGIVVGAGAGALLATLLFDRRVEEDYITDLERDLRPGTSALLCLIRSGDVATLGYSLRSFHLRVYQSTLPPQLQATLRESARY
jgi:uncharacterized membrane protein